MEYTLIGISFLIVLYVWAKVNNLEARIKGMQRTIDRFADRSGISEDPVNDELRKLIENGEDVKAIKKARETLGLSLVGGKEYIDKLKFEDSKA